MCVPANQRTFGAAIVLRACAVGKVEVKYRMKDKLMEFIRKCWKKPLKRAILSFAVICLAHEIGYFILGPKLMTFAAGVGAIIFAIYDDKT